MATNGMFCKYLLSSCVAKVTGHIFLVLLLSKHQLFVKQDCVHGLWLYCDIVVFASILIVGQPQVQGPCIIDKIIIIMCHFSSNNVGIMASLSVKSCECIPVVVK